MTSLGPVRLRLASEGVFLIIALRAESLSRGAEPRDKHCSLVLLTDRLKCSVRELGAIQTELYQASRIQVYDFNQIFVKQVRNSEVQFCEVPPHFQQYGDKFTIIEHCQRCQVRHQLEQGTKPISPMLSFIVGKPSL